MHDEIRRRSERLLKVCRITDGKNFRLADHDPGDTDGVQQDGKAEAQTLLQGAVEWLAAEQQKLYAQDRWAVLALFQAMDAAGKDGTIKHVMSGVNPQGVHVTSFKAPSAEELDHDFLWRCNRALPERGRIGIFNRSYYEEVLVVRVHEELLGYQKLPASTLTKNIWKERCEDIANHERYLARNGTRILKFFLHVSPEEQKRRLLERLDDPEKNWKFEAGDVRERSHWGQYMAAYEDMIQRTAAPHAPWYVIPADKKWFARLAVSAALVMSLDELKLEFPTVSAEKKAELAVARAALEAQVLPK